MKALAVLIHGKDNVATAVVDIPPGTNVWIEIEGASGEVKVAQTVPAGHKFAIKPINIGEHVLKYGEVIGVATEKIGVGELVHVHNVESQRGRGDLTGKSEG